MAGARSARREQFSEPVRLTLLESDIDDMQTSVETLRRTLESIRNVLIGLLVSITTAAVLLALNLVVGA